MMGMPPEENRDLVIADEKEESAPKMKFYLETYGCAMNFSDSELVTSILIEQGYIPAEGPYDADVILTNTCAIRENAEEKVRQRLTVFRKLKRQKPGLLIGVLGCMAERLKDKLVEEDDLADLVVGPDAYRNLPSIITEASSGQKAINVILSRDETYSDIKPVKLGGNGVTAFISIMRGCDNMCSFCVVPFTRGRERSRDPGTIITEAESLFERGYREVTLLGQNVNSYRWSTIGFSSLLEMVAKVSPLLRVRFSTSNPMDMTDDVLHTMAKYDNICKYIHLPVQSGSTRILQLMNRGYNRSTYLQRINTIKTILPGCTISTDIITGFCSETEEEHRETISIMREVGYDYAYMFKYSERPGTLAARKYRDDVPEDVKSRRLDEIIEVQQELSYKSNLNDMNKVFEVLVEGESKKSSQFLYGREDRYKVIVFPREDFKPGDCVNILVTKCTKGTLVGKAVIK